MRPEALLLVLLSLLLFRSFSYAELQERNQTEGGLVQEIRISRGGGGGGASGHGGSDGDRNGDSSSGGPPGRPINGAGTAGTRNHIRRHGDGTRCSVNNLSMVIAVPITISLGFLNFL